jgi:hypothetical protein
MNSNSSDQPTLAPTSLSLRWVLRTSSVSLFRSSLSFLPSISPTSHSRHATPPHPTHPLKPTETILILIHSYYNRRPDSYDPLLHPRPRGHRPLHLHRHHRCHPSRLRLPEVHCQRLFASAGAPGRRADPLCRFGGSRCKLWYRAGNQCGEEGSVGWVKQRWQV